MRGLPSLSFKTLTKNHCRLRPIERLKQVLFVLIFSCMSIKEEVVEFALAVTLSSKSHLRHLIVHLGISITEDEDIGSCGGVLRVTQVRVHVAYVIVAAALAARAIATVSTTA